MKPDCILAECRDYQQLIDALRSWIDQLGRAGETIDAIAGLPGGYTGKLLAAGARAAQRSRGRMIGRTSLGPLLGALALKIHLVVDGQALEQISRRSDWRPRNASGGVRARPKHKIRRKSPWRDNPEVARMMANQRWVGTSAEDKRRGAQMAARIRWQRVRAASARSAVATAVQSGAEPGTHPLRSGGTGARTGRARQR